MSSPAAPDPRNLRASDADRERVTDILREAVGDGRLTVDELDERLDAVYAAKTYAELEPITRDLPGAAYAPAPPAAASDPRRFGAAPTSHGAIAILGRFTRKGRRPPGTPGTDGRVAGLQDTTEFRVLVDQTSAVLLNRGMEVEPVTVRDVAAQAIDSAAERNSTDSGQAIRLVRPEAVADRIAKTADRVRATPADTTPAGTTSLVLHGRRRAFAQLRDGAVLLEADGVQREIPVAAIERAEVHGRKGRRLTVVLTGDEPVVYHLRCRNASAVHEFARAVQRALPIRDTGESRPNGADLVTGKPLERATPNRVAPNLVDLLWPGLAGVYVLVIVMLLAKAALGWDTWFSVLSDLGFLVLTPFFVGGGVVIGRVGWELAREYWVLRTRGITVVAERKPGSYEYVDIHGVRHTHSSDHRDERDEITYDLMDPETAMTGHQTTEDLVFSLVFSAFFFLMAALVLLPGIAGIVAAVVLLAS